MQWSKAEKTLRINGEPKQRVKINAHNVHDGRDFCLEIIKLNEILAKFQ